MASGVLGAILGGRGLSPHDNPRDVRRPRPVLEESLITGNAEAARKIEAMLASLERNENMRGLAMLNEGRELGLFSRPAFLGALFHVGTFHHNMDVQLEAVKMLFETTGPGDRGTEVAQVACEVPEGHWAVRDEILARLAEDFKRAPEKTISTVREIAMKTKYRETGNAAARMLGDFEAWPALNEVFAGAECGEVRKLAYYLIPSEHRMDGLAEILAT